MITLTSKQCDELHIYLLAAINLIDSKPLKRGLQSFDDLIVENACKYPGDDQGMYNDLAFLNDCYDDDDTFVSVDPAIMACPCPDCDFD